MNERIFRFGDFTLEPTERRLSHNGRPIALTPKVFDTLVLLVQQAGRVVTKEELMRTLWPRGYVDDSNLTKHIWLIRRALGEGEADTSAIETVPKVGYRFVAPVQIGVRADIDTPAAPSAEAPSEEAPPPEAAIQSAPSGPGHRRRAPWRWVALAAVVVISTSIVLGFRNVHRRGPEHPTFALLGFSNLSGDAKDAWIGPALTDMLQTELNAAPSLQSVPNEWVRSVSLDLPPPTADGYPAETLMRLRQRLKVDYVISGSYFVSASPGGSTLRVDFSLQETGGAALLATISRRSDVNSLMSLSSEAGIALLGKLGIEPPDAEVLARATKLQPPSIDVARRMGYALDALDHDDPARARDELLQAVAESPGYAPAYGYLSRAWDALGYHAKALAAAEQAAARSADLPAEQRLEAQALVSMSRNDWRQAGHDWSALVTLRPGDIDYRLHAIDAAIAAGSAAEARAGIDALRPLAAGDPRVALAEARLAGAFDDARGAEQAASAAVKQAQQRDAGGLLAEAQVALAGARMHLNQNEAARAGLLEAIETYRHIHNPRGEAAARNNLAGALAHLDRNPEAREEYQRAMALYQGVGDLAGQASVYRNLCGMLWSTGDRDGAQAAARRGLELGRETADVPMQSWMLQALANIENDDNASDEVLQEFREVVNLNERSGHQTAWPLSNVADVQRLRGDLAAAHATCEQSLAESARLSDPQFIVFSTFTCGLIASDQGEISLARTRFNEVLRRAKAGGAASYVWDSQMMLGQLDLDEHLLSEACARLRLARDGFAASEERTGEADASALLAECERARGDRAASDAALSHAQALRRAITSRQEVYQVDIIAARLGGSARDSINDLMRLAADARQRHFIGWSLEARLAAWQLSRAQGLAQAGDLRAGLEKDAGRLGYGRILRLLSGAP